MTIRSLLFAVFFLCSALALRAESHCLQMSVDDFFTVAATEQWSIKVDKYMPLRQGNVLITPKGKQTFSLKLFFLCDTKDLATFDTPEKMKRAVIESSKHYLKVTVEKEIVPTEIPNLRRFGFRVNLTDADLVRKKPIPEGQFIYMRRGMVRLSEDSALGYSLMSNDLNSEETQKIEKYIFSFIKSKE